MNEMSNTETWYKVRHDWNCYITPVQVIKETEKTVQYINKRWEEAGVVERAGKCTHDHSFFKTLDEAKDRAFRHLSGVVHQAEMKIQRANDERKVIEAMTESK